MKKWLTSSILILFAAAFIAAVFSQPAAAQTFSPGPFSFTLQAKLVSADTIAVNWKVTGGSEAVIEIERAVSPKSDSFSQFAIVKGSASQNDTVSPGTVYTYKAVRSASGVSQDREDVLEQVSVTVPLATPTLTEKKARPSSTGVRSSIYLGWTAVPGAASYEVYALENGNRTLVVNTGNATAHISLLTTPNKKYQVRAVSASKIYSEFSNVL